MPTFTPNYMPDADFPNLEPSGGLTKRELFAAMAMQAMVSSYDMIAAALNVGAKTDVEAKDVIARGAISYADALIAELEKQK